MRKKNRMSFKKAVQKIMLINRFKVEKVEYEEQSEDEYQGKGQF